jgi:hypothetical protein
MPEYGQDYIRIPLFGVIPETRVVPQSKGSTFAYTLVGKTAGETACHKVHLASNEADNEFHLDCFVSHFLFALPLEQLNFVLHS